MVEEEILVEDVDVGIYPPGPPLEHYDRHQVARKKEHDEKKYPLTTFTLPDGSVTVVFGPKPTN